MWGGRNQGACCRGKGCADGAGAAPRRGGAAHGGTRADALLMAPRPPIPPNPQPATFARAGDSADLQLTGIEPGSAHPGAVLCHPSFPARTATRLEARLLLLDVPAPLLRGASVTLHCHTAREEGVVSALAALLDGKTGEEIRKRPRCLLKGQVKGGSFG